MFDFADRWWIWGMLMKSAPPPSRALLQSMQKRMLLADPAARPTFSDLVREITGAAEREASYDPPEAPEAPAEDSGSLEARVAALEAALARCQNKSL